ncbi:MAG: hypothetical protein ACLFWD_12405 [Anaerolineales bacterium]
MPRYLIEVPHEDRKDACKRAVQVFNDTGSHFMTNADWGCADDVHKAWIVIELESKEQARSMLPPLYRQKANIIELQKLGQESFEDAEDLHG